MPFGKTAFFFSLGNGGLFDSIYSWHRFQEALVMRETSVDDEGKHLQLMQRKMTVLQFFEGFPVWWRENLNRFLTPTVPESPYLADIMIEHVLLPPSVLHE